ncbi:hypothetical protein KEM52_002070, partial [Ascosphaera acerosa]
GHAAKASPAELGISLAPTPDYPGIAQAAAGGALWAGTASTVSEYEQLLPEAIRSVQDGRSAVLELQFGGTEGAYRPEKAARPAA